MATTDKKPVAKTGSSALERLKARTAPMAVQEGGEQVIPLSKIQFDSTQPRSAFHHPDGQIAAEDKRKVEELAESIKGQGLIQPITVRPGPDGTFIVVVGERRTRAHVLLGLPTIRAYVRYDLAEETAELVIVQMVENVVRDDLPDTDIARKIKQLMEGVGKSAPMSQSQIAQKLGKSEGYVSRYVRYGKEELQRLWIKTGIVDTVEHLYRVSVLPEPIQAEIQRRVSLDPENPDFLAKPLLRGFLDDMARQAKIAKASAAAAQVPAAPVPPSAKGEASDSSSGSAAAQSEEGAAAGSSADPMTKALTDAAADGQGEKGAATGMLESNTTLAGTTYTLPDHLRASILAGAGVTADDSHPSGSLPPVNVRGPLNGLLELMAQLDKDDAKEAQGLFATISLPAPLAQALANKVSGMIVEPRAVAAALQRHLSES